MQRWLNTGSVKLRTPAAPGLPDPITVLAETDSTRDAVATMSANDSAEHVLKSSRKRKRGSYANYNDETRAKIAKCAIDNGVASTARKYSKELGLSVSETSVRSMRDAYIKIKKSSKGMRFNSVTCA